MSAIQYRTEAQTLEGEMIVIPQDSLKDAKSAARYMSKRHITAYAVAVRDGVAIGHVAYGEGRRTEILGEVA